MKSVSLINMLSLGPLSVRILYKSIGVSPVWFVWGETTFEIKIIFKIHSSIYEMLWLE